MGVDVGPRVGTRVGDVVGTGADTTTPRSVSFILEVDVVVECSDSVLLVSTTGDSVSF